MFAAFDEADILVDKSFKAELDSIVTPLLSKRSRGEVKKKIVFEKQVEYFSKSKGILSIFVLWSYINYSIIKLREWKIWKSL